MKIYNKLVRDNIPEIMIKNGVNPVIKTLNEEEYLKELNKKLLEEVKEYLESENVEEIADIEEVILSILKLKGISKQQVEEIRQNKVLKRGSFNKKIFLIRED